MQTEIYLDVLILTNLYVTYFLLLSTAKMMSYKTAKRRLFVGSMVGGAYSLIILADLNTAEYIVIKLLMGVSLVFIVFFNKKMKPLVKSMLYFTLVNFIYGGLMMALYLFVSPANMLYRNSVAYFNISVLQLVIFTIIAYFAIIAFCYFFKKYKNNPNYLKTKIVFLGQEVNLSGFVDTGNKLVDVFSGDPVIICSYDSVVKLIPPQIKEYFNNPIEYTCNATSEYKYKKRLKLVFASGAFNEISIPAFSADYVEINGEKKEAVVAVSKKIGKYGNCDVILNPSLL